MNAKHAVLIALAMIALVLVAAAPVTAGTPNEDGLCIVPPNEYFVKDSPMNGGTVHEGIQIGYVFWITEYTRFHELTGNHYLGLTTYKLKESHNEQVKIALGRMFYCYSMPEKVYIPDPVRPDPENEPLPTLHGSSFLFQ